jgi:hypothetical protein
MKTLTKATSTGRSLVPRPGVMDLISPTSGKVISHVNWATRKIPGASRRRGVRFDFGRTPRG